MSRFVIGVDIGGVVIDRVARGVDTSFFADRYLETPAVEGAIEALAVLSVHPVHFVSKCGPRVEERTRRWLEHHGVFVRTGIPPENLYFCRDRKDKAPICEQLGVTHFVDDRLDVLQFLTTVPHRYLFRPRDGDRRRAASARVRLVESWPEILADLAS